MVSATWFFCQSTNEAWWFSKQKIPNSLWHIRTLHWMKLRWAHYHVYAAPYIEVDCNGWVRYMRCDTPIVPSWLLIRHIHHLPYKGDIMCIRTVICICRYSTCVSGFFNLIVSSLHVPVFQHALLNSNDCCHDLLCNSLYVAWLWHGGKRVYMHSRAHAVTKLSIYSIPWQLTRASWLPWCDILSFMHVISHLPFCSYIVMSSWHTGPFV